MLKSSIVSLLLAGCACYHSSSSGLTAAEVDASTYLVDTGMGTGTGWVVEPGFLMTAGHVCGLAMTGGAWLRGPSGEIVHAEPLVFEVSADASADACILDARGPVGAPLPMAGTEPEPGTPDGMVGYPLGQHRIVSGTYAGLDRSSDPTDHGNSGSPMFTGDGVYGLCVALHGDGTPGCDGTGVTEVRRLLRRANILPED